MSSFLWHVFDFWMKDISRLCNIWLLYCLMNIFLSWSCMALSARYNFNALWVVACRYKKLLSSVDLTKDFFYSYTYPIMQSLQSNVQSNDSVGIHYDSRFVWNMYLTEPVRTRCKNNIWTVALVHGYFKQVCTNFYSVKFYILVIDLLCFMRSKILANFEVFSWIFCMPLSLDIYLLTKFLTCKFGLLYYNFSPSYHKLSTSTY